MSSFKKRQAAKRRIRADADQLIRDFQAKAVEEARSRAAAAQAAGESDETRDGWHWERVALEIERRERG
ncbi:hypothetical protein [Phreatobacter stygius]|uniref:DUF4169 family protein n=1 Tax=Phreatobacter stygius TaxID=1940610 RepID=A0A4D7B8F6_9HYPH|nr:hypothetical protein [Phreatobacter stygius]QCI67225.1 hypothetical protein E8M01_25120 [Phreatobacter stygius]